MTKLDIKADEKNTQKNFRISKKLLDDFKKVCDEKGLEDSEILRYLILEFVEKNKDIIQKENPT